MNELIFCLITAFKITAIYVCCQPGMIFFAVRQRIGLFLNSISCDWWAKPLFECLPCMASIWGTVFYFLSDWEENYLSVIFITCGMLAVIDHFIPEHISGDYEANDYD